nr:cytochrome c oxidase assembly protein [Fodinicola feengrottensis]
MHVQPLTMVTAVTTWTPDAVSLVLAIALGAGYLWALRRVPGWPLARSAAFFGGGLGSMLLVSVTFVGAYDDVLFWVRAVQVIVLLMITPFAWRWARRSRSCGKPAKTRQNLTVS